MACVQYHGDTGAGNHKLMAERTFFTKMTGEIRPVLKAPVFDSLDGGCFFGLDRFLKYGPNSACRDCLSFSESVDMKTSIALVKSSRSLSTGSI